MPQYQFKTKAEFVWFALTTIGVALAQAFIANTNPSTPIPTDWRLYAVSILGGAVRPVIALIMAQVGTPTPATTAPVPPTTK